MRVVSPVQPTGPSGDAPPPPSPSLPSRASMLNVILSRVIELYGVVSEGLMQLLGLLGDAIASLEQLPGILWLGNVVDRLDQLSSRSTGATTPSTIAATSVTAAAPANTATATTMLTAIATQTGSTPPRSLTTAPISAIASAARTRVRSRQAVRPPHALRDAAIANQRQHIAAARAAALAPKSIADVMRSCRPPTPPSLEQLDREALMFPASRPRHDYFAIVVAGAPTVSSTPDLPPIFDDLLLPPHERQDRAHVYERMPNLQASVAQARINLAVVRARDTSPPTTDSSFACACGWCPNGTAAYPLCVAVTMRRTMRSFGKRATTSHASDAARRQSAMDHHDCCDRA